MICAVHPVSEHGEPFAWCPTCGKHNCQFQGKLGELLYICSRCHGCYICRHKFILFGDGEYRVKCKDGKFRPLIMDGRLQGPPLYNGPCPSHGWTCRADKLEGPVPTT